MLQAEFVEKIKTLISHAILFSENLTFHNVEKYCTARQATGDNTAHALCMHDN